MTNNDAVLKVTAKLTEQTNQIWNPSKTDMLNMIYVYMDTFTHNQQNLCAEYQ